MQHSKPKLILNADDYGSHPSVDAAILDAAKNGVLTSTTVIINTPSAQHAISNALRVPNLKMGIHVNLTHGKPTLPSSDVPELVNERGFFKFPLNALIKMSLLGRLNSDFLDQAYLEMKSQVRIAKSYGINPSHMDSHQHIHTIPKIRERFFRVADENNIKKVRQVSEPLKAYRSRLLLKEFFRHSAFARWGYMKYTHKKIPSGYQSTQYFLGLFLSGEWREEALLACLKNLKNSDSIEVGVHPGHPVVSDLNYYENTEFEQWISSSKRQIETDIMLSPTFKDSIESMGFKLCSFADL